MWFRLATIAVLLVLIGTGAAAQLESLQSADRVSREQFLAAVDHAFDARDRSALKLLVGPVAAERDADSMLLPTGPLVRTRDLSTVEVLYRGEAGRMWSLRLALDRVTRQWRIVTRPALCPPAVPTRPRAAAPESASPAKMPWAVLQCWPLPD